MSAHGLHDTSTSVEYIRVIDKQFADMEVLRTRVIELEGLVKKDHKKRNLTEEKSFGQLDKYSGDEKTWSNWEFKLFNFVRHVDGCEAYLDWCKDRDDAITLIEINEKQQDIDAKGNNNFDLSWCDEQLYAMLVHLCTGTALGSVKLMREERGTRGSNSWFRLTRDVAGKSGSRLEHLADKVHHQKPFSSWHTAMSVLEK